MAPRSDGPARRLSMVSELSGQPFGVFPGKCSRFFDTPGKELRAIFKLRQLAGSTKAHSKRWNVSFVESRPEPSYLVPFM